MFRPPAAAGNPMDNPSGLDRQKTYADPRMEGGMAEGVCAPTSGGLTSRQRFLAACRCQRVDRPPIWLMRQAGRALPEYRALKEHHSFLGMVQTPELATEVTLQPIRRFGFDAAILFSDILVVAEALGQGYRFRDTGGIQMDFALRCRSDVDRLERRAVCDRLAYVDQALRLVRHALGDRTALIGFAGAPWTLLNFMTEGGSSQRFQSAWRLFEEDRPLFDHLSGILAGALTEYLRMQIDAGVDAVMVFDTLAGQLRDERYWDAAGRWIPEIVGPLQNRVPVILFAKGINRSWAVLSGTGVPVLGVDWTVRLADVRRQVPSGVALQGNLDPAVLTTSPDQVVAAARAILTDLRGVRGHVFNLGHGVPPEAKLENLEALVQTVRSFV